ncbi:hypothetical protein [Salinibacterium sp. ZJ454]|uniref:hypothetical protein n=1 Tax=Salinibacterium sp. ZJ454 TaxID=2708339 RepID=UPI0014212706|nr:hypothetical protein [Salinibacterium sp. ZJ454]
MKQTQYRGGVFSLVLLIVAWVMAVLVVPFWAYSIYGSTRNVYWNDGVYPAFVHAAMWTSLAVGLSLLVVSMHLWRRYQRDQRDQRHERDQQQHSRSRRRVALTFAGVVPCLAAFVWSIGAASQYEHGSTEQTMAVANQLAVSDNWELIDEFVRGESLRCWLNECPEVVHRWQTDGELTPQGLAALTAASGWNLPIDGTCQRRENRGGDSMVCSAEGSADSFYLRVHVYSPSVDEPHVVRISVVRQHHVPYVG